MLVAKRPDQYLEHKQQLSKQNNTLSIIPVLNQAWCFYCNCYRTVDDRLSSLCTVDHTRECVWRLDSAYSSTFFLPCMNL